MLDLLLADKYTANSRYNICKECPHFKPKSKRCELCGCFMKVKTKIISQKWIEWRISRTFYLI